MTHEQALERLDDFVCGELPDIERVRVQRHVDTCGECQAEVGAIQALLAEAATLPRAIAPPHDLWAGIAPRLEPRAAPLVVEHDPKVIPLAPRRRHWQPPRWALQIAAALVLMVGSSAVTALLMRQRQPAQAGGPVALAPIVANQPPAARQAGVGTPAPGAVPVTNPAAAPRTPTAFAAFRPAERDYQSAIGDLQKVLDGKRGEMAPETVETLERNLRIIDAAIAESRAALVKDPNSRELIDMLSATYDAKVKVLRQAVEI